MKTRVLPAESPDPNAVLSASYPSRGAAEELSQRICALLREGGYGVGDRFKTDDELVELTGLSRSTVRRALIAIKEEGWLSSKAGLGTFVGRVSGTSVTVRGTVAAPAIRIGVMAFNSRMPVFDWLTPLLLNGVNEVAGPAGTRVELLGGFADTLEQSLERLERCHPDVIACLSSDPGDAMLLRAASDRGMRCIVVGTLFPDLSVPRVCEDNRGGMDLAVRKLAAMGHRRIGLVMRRWVGSWLFKRHEQWHDSLQALGLPFDEQLMHWLPQSDAKVMAREAIEELGGWIENTRPTAVICGHYLPAMHLGHLRREGRLRIPQDLSVVVVDRHPEVQWMLGIEPTTIELPLAQIGRTLVDLAHQWRNGVQPPTLTQIPMTWRDGLTVAPLDGATGGVPNG